MQFAVVQVLNTRYVRRLITLQKHKAYDAAEGQQWLESNKDLKLAIDGIHEMVYASRTTREERAGKKLRYRSKRT
jgi:hypothetical protein